MAKKSYWEYILPCLLVAVIAIPLIGYIISVVQSKRAERNLTGKLNAYIKRGKTNNNANTHSGGSAAQNLVSVVGRIAENDPNVSSTDDDDDDDESYYNHRGQEIRDRAFASDTLAVAGPSSSLSNNMTSAHIIKTFDTIHDDKQQRSLNEGNGLTCLKLNSSKTIILYPDYVNLPEYYSRIEFDGASKTSQGGGEKRKCLKNTILRLYTFNFGDDIKVDAASHYPCLYELKINWGQRGGEFKSIVCNGKAIPNSPKKPIGKFSIIVDKKTKQTFIKTNRIKYLLTNDNRVTTNNTETIKALSVHKLSTSEQRLNRLIIVSVK